MSAAEETRWATVYGTSERVEDVKGDLIKVTVEGLTHVDPDLPTTQRIGFVVIIDEALPFDRHHKMRRLVAALEKRGIA